MPPTSFSADRRSTSTGSISPKRPEVRYWANATNIALQSHVRFWAKATLTLPPIRRRSRHGIQSPQNEDRRRQAAEKEAAARRVTEKQILEDAGHLVAVWNERQAKRMPMLFSPTIGAAIAAGYWFLWARCPACRTTGDVDLRSLDWHRGAAVTALITALSCRSCRPHAPFVELVCLSRCGVAEDFYAERVART